MKVCILTTAHSPFDERIFHKEAKSLEMAGNEVVIIAPHTQNQLRDGIRIRAVPPFRSRRERVYRLRDIYRAAKLERADVYHFHDPDLIPVGMLLQRRARVIYDVHEYYGDSLMTRYWLPRPLRYLAAHLFDKLEKFSARFFDAVITVNSHMAGQFQRVNPLVEVLHNYPLESQFTLPRPEKPKAPVILYLGGINRERGLEVILRAMALVTQVHPEAVCELVGPAETEDLSAEFADLEAWLQRGNVKLRGKIPYEEVPRVLEESGIALVPLLPTLNYQKAIPIKLLEYMAAGLPVIGSDFGYIESIISKNKCGVLFEAGNHAALAQSISRLIEDPESSLEFGQNGWDGFHREYTWEREQAKLLRIYQGIAKEEQ